MPKPTRKPALWAVIAFYVAGVLSIVYSSYRWAMSGPDDFVQWSSGRGIPLPGWGWIALGYVVGLAMLAFATYAERWRRRWE
jgi:hypothetical protein